METLIETRAITRGTVVRAEADDLWVDIAGQGPVACDVLKGALTGGGRLRRGDLVLATLPGGPESRGCVLGLVTPYRPEGAASGAPEERRISAKTLVLEAGERLELRVTDSTIVIDEEGRITVHGKNVVSRARGVNTIRGGAVRIN
jgi:hypothetical protein